MHYYKFNIADWNLSTAHLTLEEEAIYFRLVNFYYDSESPIPKETQSVFRRLRFGSNDEIPTAILTEFFHLNDKGWFHNRCDNILKDYRKTVKKNKANGANGGRPRKTKGCEVSQDKPSGLPSESQNNPNQEPLTTNQEPETKENNISVDDKPSTCPHMKIIDLYHDNLPRLPRVVKDLWPGSARESALRARWKENPKHQSLKFWEKYFKATNKIDWYFEGTGTGQYENWTATLEFLINKKNFANTVERLTNLNGTRK